VRFVLYCSGSSTGVIYASSSYPFYWEAESVTPAGAAPWTDFTVTHASYAAESSGGTGYVPGYRTSGADGEWLELRGRILVANTTNADIVGTFPTGYRPLRSVNFSFGNGQSTYIGGTINPSGQLVVNRTVSSVSWLSLDGIRISLK
jgi:hypothetical protein